MLGVISLQADDGSADATLANVASKLTKQGVPLAGAIQMNTVPRAGCACDMDLSILRDDGPPVRITQSLGTGSRGCRLDAGALAVAAARAAMQLSGARLVIINKFGKQESLGGGFRDLFAQALEAGIPVLTSVSPEYRAAFAAFAGDLAEPVTDAEAWAARALSRDPAAI